MSRNSSLPDWPPHGRRVDPWQSKQRAPSRADRMITEVTVSLPPKIADLGYVTDAALQAEMESAAYEVVRLDSRPERTIRALGHFLIRTESVASSKIEHIDATVADYARAMAGIRSNENATSMVAASSALARLVEHAGIAGSVTLDAILDAHRILMRDDPLDGPYAGTLRTVQNWIGGSDYSPRGAVHIPPPPDTVPGYLEDLVAFANRNDVPAIAQAAIVHAQFESIHPFTDGNGRIGRALINAVLRRRGVTTGTVVPIASAMLARRDEYFALVNGYRRGFLRPFVQSLARSTSIASMEAARSAETLAELPGEWAETSNPRKGSAAGEILAHLLDTPVISVDEAVRLTGASPTRAYEAMNRLESDGVIHEVTNRKRDKVWAATEVLAELDNLSLRIADAVTQPA